MKASHNQNFFYKLANLNANSPRQVKIAIVCNITAGNGRSRLILSSLLEKAEHLALPYLVFTESWPGNLEGFTSVWLIGGDGTLNYFINQYPAINIPIAVFKGGSGNDFAWKLYGNKSIDEYFEIVMKGHSSKVDTGICNGRHFINGVGIGFDGEVVRAMGQKKIISGHLGYLLIVLKKIFSYREKEMRIVVDNSDINEKIFMINVANGSRYGGGFLVAPQSIINDGELDIVVIKQIAPLKRLSYLPKVEAGKHLQLSLVDVLKKKKITIQSSFILPAHLDGELMQADKFEIEIIPNSLSFIY